MKKNIKKILIEKYIKNFVKNPMIFYASIFMFCIGILLIMVSVKIETTKTYSGNLAENKIVINELADHQIVDIYVYKNNEDRKYPIVVNSVENIEQFTLLYFDDDNYNKRI